jgi:triphosphoribosyl-dephospho-CoA synthase
MHSREDDVLARTALDALTEQLALAPKPGLSDPRDLGARSGLADHCSLRWSATALVPGLAAMAAATRR